MRAMTALAGAGLLAVLPTAAMAQEAEPCAFELQVSDEFLVLLQQWGALGVEGTEGLCQRLKVEGAGLNIVENSGISDFGAYAVVMIGLVDKASALNSPNLRIGLTTMDGREEADHENALRQALQQALTALVADPDPVIASLRQEIDFIRRNLAPPPTS